MASLCTGRGVVWTTIAFTSSLSFGCDSSSETPRPTHSELGAYSRADPAEAASEVIAEPEPVEVIEVLEVETEDDHQERGARRELASGPIDLVPAELEWSAGAVADGALDFVAIAEGLALFGEGRVRSFDEDGVLQPAVALELPDAELLGRWPDDVWYAKQAPLEVAAAGDGDGGGDEGLPRVEYELFRLGAEGAFEPVAYRKRAQWIAGPQAARDAGGEGLVILEGSRASRAGSHKEIERVGQRMGKLVLDVVESRAGVLYSMSLRTNGVYVQRSCADTSCVGQHARRLPHGKGWRFGAHVSRGSEALSLIAEVEVEGMNIPHLLHQDGEHWQLDSIAELPRGMWGSAGGGLWVLVDDELWYRGARGGWSSIVAPGTGHLSVAWDPKADVLWLARRESEQTALFMTPASLERLD